MINIVLFGSFIWVLLVCYLFMLKGELLCDSKYYWGGRDMLCQISNGSICTKEWIR